jgi:hypothetical protein
MDKQTTRKAAEIRAAVRALGTRGQGRRYPEALKRKVLTYLAGRRKAGRGLRTASAELGIPQRSITLWSISPRPLSSPKFVPVTVDATTAAEVPEPRLVVLGPIGVRIEGLDVAMLADLLRRLG